MTAQTPRIRPAQFLSVAVLAAAMLVATALDARAACFTNKVQIPVLQSKLQAPALQPKLQAVAGAAAQSAVNGGGPIVGQWQVVMTAFPGTNNEFIFDFGFQQFHSDGTELMISGGVPPTIGNVCIGAWERGASGEIRLRHMTWNWAGNEVLGDLPTGYFLLEVILRTNSQGTAYAGTWRAASFDLGAGPLGSGGPPQPNSEFEGTLQAGRVSVQ
jgi:hypothetical protein